MLKLTQSRKFLIIGFVNFTITNGVLQILLLNIPIWISTLISQFLNFLIGYFSYSKYVFNYRGLNENSFLKYIFLSIFSWYLNANLIFLFTSSTELSANTAALINIPILTGISFFVQKYLIFR